jgi:prephenate dehydrogenase
LWAEIVAANPHAVASALRDVTTPLLELAEVLGSANPDRAADKVRELIERGRSGRAKFPGKHGERQTPWATVSVVVPDRPGALAELLAAVAQHRVNLEDLRVEHAPGQPEGSAELAIDVSAQARLTAALQADGWTVSLGADAPR